MKNLIFFTLGLLLLFTVTLNSQASTPQEKPQPGSAITISSSAELFGLTQAWAKAYTKVNPALHVEVVRSVAPSSETRLSTTDGLSFVSESTATARPLATDWRIVVGHEAIVPVINAQNPYLAEIALQGLSARELAGIFQNSGQNNWGELLGIAKTANVNAYYVDHALVTSGLSGFLKIDSKNILATKTTDGAQMLAAISNDPNAIGFCSLRDILDMTTLDLPENISLLPIDRNDNGLIDYKEKIYDNLGAFMRGAWIGKYPKALCSNIYSVAGSKPTNTAELAFLNWVLSDGQQLLNAQGYYDLAYNERQLTTDQLLLSTTPFIASMDKNAMAKLVLLILGGLLILGFLVDALVRYFLNRKSRVPDAASIHPFVFNESALEVPKGLYYDKSHTWAFMEKDGLVKIGIDDFLQHITGPLTQIKMKNAGEKVRRGDELVTIIQKGKQLRITAPVSGIIMAQNKNLIKETSLINASPYSEGWVYMIEPANWSKETQFLSMAEKQRAALKNEFLRLKDFLASAVKPSSLAFAHVVLQDGGELSDNILENLGPEVWEDFQQQFIDTNR